VGGAPLETGRKLQQLPPGNDKAAFSGSLAKFACDLPKMLAVQPSLQPQSCDPP
jgi:hypothetical protein